MMPLLGVVTSLRSTLSTSPFCNRMRSNCSPRRLPELNRSHSHPVMTLGTSYPSHSVEESVDSLCTKPAL